MGNAGNGRSLQNIIPVSVSTFNVQCSKKTATFCNTYTQFLLTDYNIFTIKFRNDQRTLSEMKFITSLSFAALLCKERGSTVL